MKREDAILIGIPFIFSAVIIFGHYKLLNIENPQAHTQVTVTKTQVEPIASEGLAPISPRASFPKEVVGSAHEIPTTKKQLKNLLENIKEQQTNTLFLVVGISINAEGQLIIPKAVDSSEEMLIRWTKKTISDAHRAGIHTHLSFLFINEPLIPDVDQFMDQLEGYIERWGSLAQEYNVSFFDAGIILGHSSFQTIGEERLQELVVRTERKVREVYTGRIGIGICCQLSNVIPRGFNQIILISKTGNVSNELQNKAQLDAQAFNVEHIFLLNLETQKVSTIL